MVEQKSALLAEAEYLRSTRDSLGEKSKIVIHNCPRATGTSVDVRDAVRYSL